MAALVVVVLVVMAVIGGILTTYSIIQKTRRNQIFEDSLEYDRVEAAHAK